MHRSGFGKARGHLRARAIYQKETKKAFDHLRYTCLRVQQYISIYDYAVTVKILSCVYTSCLSERGIMNHLS